MGPCIADVFPSISSKMQRYAIYLFLWNALHVSDGSSARHQELKTVYTALGTLSNLYCYLPLSIFISSTTVAGSSRGLRKCLMLYIQFWAPDDGRRNCIYSIGYFVKPLLLPATVHLHLFHDSGRESKALRKGLMLYIQFWAPDDGRRNCIHSIGYLVKPLLLPATVHLHLFHDSGR